jgi:hypothetical protein
MIKNWIIDDEKMNVHLLFEVDGLAEDEDSNPSPALYRIGVPCRYTPGEEELLMASKIFVERGELPGIGAGWTIRPIDVPYLLENYPEEA